MNQSMAVAYATLGREFLALMLRVVMVRTVVTPEDKMKMSVMDPFFCVLKDSSVFLQPGSNFVTSFYEDLETRKLCPGNRSLKV